MPVCRCCCIDFYLSSLDAPGPPSGSNGAYRRLRMSGEYPHNTIDLKDQPSTAPATSICSDTRNGLVFAMHLVNGQRAIHVYDADSLTRTGAVMPLPTTTVGGVLACNWRDRVVYYVVKTVSSTAGAAPATHSYAFEIRSVNYDSSNLGMVVTTDSGTSVAAAPQVTWNSLRWTPLGGGRIYYAMRKKALNVNSGQDEDWAYLKWIPADGFGLPTEIVTLENPDQEPVSSFSDIFDAGVSTRQHQVVWTEFRGFVPNDDIFYIKRSDLDGLAPVTIRTWDGNPNDPNEDAARYVLVNEKENAIFFTQASRAGGHTGHRMQRIEFDGGGRETIYDTHQTQFKNLAHSFTNKVAMGCGQEFKGAEYQGDG